MKECIKKISDQMILLNLDGTLLTSNNTVSPITADAIEICKLKGYYKVLLLHDPDQRKIYNY